MQDLPEKKYSLPLKGMYVIICNMQHAFNILYPCSKSNIQYNNEGSPARKEAFVILLVAIFLWDIFSVSNTPTN